MEKAEDICVRCGKVIGESEKAYVADDGLVCIECDRKSVESKNASPQKIHNTPKKKTCIWAKISFFSALSSWIVLALVFLVADGFQLINEGLFEFVLLLSCVLMVIAFLSVIVGSIRIIAKKDILKGWLYIAGGICLSFLFFFMGILLPALGAASRTSPRVECGSNLAALGKAILLYSQDNDGRYPTPDMWCDLLLKNADVDEENFICKGALKSGDKGRCHYALNPNCSPDSPDDVVLLFESRGGWNQYGGLELLTTEYHVKEKSKGCNILFNNTSVRFIRTEQLSELKWE